MAETNYALEASRQALLQNGNAGAGAGGFLFLRDTPGWLNTTPTPLAQRWHLQCFGRGKQRGRGDKFTAGWETIQAPSMGEMTAGIQDYPITVAEIHPSQIGNVSSGLGDFSSFASMVSDRGIG